MTAVRAERRSQAERRDEAERRLLKAAIALVAEHGVERITMADVGEAAGYSRGLPAHYFGGKPGLIVTLAEQLVRDFGRALTRVEHHPLGLERLIGTVRFYLERAQREPVGARALLVLLGEGLSNPLIRAPMAELNARSVGAFESNLEAAKTAGAVRADVDCAAQAFLILSTVRGAVGQWLLAPQSIDLNHAGDALAANLKRSLAP